MKKLFLATAAVVAFAGAAPAANLVLGFGTGAQSGSSTGYTANTLAGQGSIGNGAAAVAAGTSANMQSSGAAFGLTTLGGSAAGSTTNASGNITSGSVGISAGQAGQFGGAASSAINGSDASGFGFSGLGINLP